MDDQKVMEMLALLLQGQTEMRGELGEVRGELGEVRGEMSEVRGEMSEVRKDLNKLSIKVEGEILDKIRGLYDYREVQNKVNEKIFSALESIEAKLHSVQLDTYRAMTRTFPTQSE